MAKVYADLIRKGVKTIDDVPQKLKSAVIELLPLIDNEQNQIG